MDEIKSLFKVNRYRTCEMGKITNANKCRMLKMFSLNLKCISMRHERTSLTSKCSRTNQRNEPVLVLLH